MKNECLQVFVLGVFFFYKLTINYVNGFCTMWDCRNKCASQCSPSDWNAPTSDKNHRQLIFKDTPVSCNVNYQRLISLWYHFQLTTPK